MITSFDQLDLSKKYTYADYLLWQFKERVELILGKIYKMSPAPSTEHQRVLGDMYVIFRTFLRKNPCRVFLAPFDVRIPMMGNKDENIETVVQPDMCVICNTEIIDEKGCLGVPDLVVEILSPHSATRDLNYKYNLYEMSGVKEYWVVEPVIGVITVYVLSQTGKFEAYKPYTVYEEAQSRIFPGLVFGMKDLFPDLLNEPDLEYEKSIRRI